MYKFVWLRSGCFSFFSGTVAHKNKGGSFKPFLFYAGCAGDRPGSLASSRPPLGSTLFIYIYIHTYIYICLFIYNMPIYVFRPRWGPPRQFGPTAFSGAAAPG